MNTRIALIMASWLTAFAPCTAPATGSRQAAADTAAEGAALDIFKQLIAINTTDSVGNVTAAAEAMAQRFRAAGFPAADIAVLGPNERKKNLVVRLHGSGRHRPVLIMGHLDVVEARREDWSTDPFTLVEKDGFYFARGAIDMKDGDAVMVSTLIRMKQEGFRPARDIVLALTADEEGGCCNGVDWLLKNQRPLIDAEYAISLDDWTIWTGSGPPRIMEVDATEKTYADYELLVTSPGGHSSEPAGDNAIYRLIAGLTRLGAYEFPFELNAVSRAYYERMTQLVDADRAADMRAILGDPPDAAAVRRLDRTPKDHAYTHTTCVPTRLDAGHANNALPQRASAIVNCRILPGHSQEEVRQRLLQVVADPGITVDYVADDGRRSARAPERQGFAPVRLDARVMESLQAALSAAWPGRTVVATMALGASDAIYTVAAGLPTYTVAAIAVRPEDSRAHGRDERVGVEDFRRYTGFYYRFLRMLTTQ